MDVTMPQLGETVTEGMITRWFKQAGQTIEADEPLFEVSTDKVDSEVPAPMSGVVTEIRVPEGETVAVGTVLAVIEDADAAPSTPSTAEAPAAPVVVTPPASAPPPEPVIPAPPPEPIAPAPTPVEPVIPAPPPEPIAPEPIAP
ncbi:MAG: biotin/lipoyl-containing protein, partial [Acidimicrobiia bacterium]